jgi:hypothetical protein
MEKVEKLRMAKEKNLIRRKIRRVYGTGCFDKEDKRKNFGEAKKKGTVN